MAIGVYKITNSVNGKVYIGQSWNIEHRWKTEKTGIQCNQHLKSAITLYGLENFIFEILIELKDNLFTQKYLDRFEEYYGELYDARNPEKGYNIRGYGSKGKHSELTKQKIRNAHEGRTQSALHTQKISKSNTGKKRSKEVVQRMRERNQGKIISEAQKKKQREKMIGRVQPDEVKKKISEFRKSFVVSEETKQKMKESALKRWSHT